MRLMRKVADFLLATYLFIAIAAACLVLTTYILAGQKPQLTALPVLVFFSTLLIYNFHKVSSLFTGYIFSIPAIRRHLEKISFSTKFMIVIAVLGITTSALFVHPKTLISIFPLALITFAYSVPVLKINRKKKRLREIFLIKITTLAFVWSFATVTLPLIDSGIDTLTKSSASIFIMRFLFMFAICIPFEIRDMEQEKKWGNTTLPLMLGVQGSKLLGLLMLLIFILLVPADDSKNNFAFPLYLSAFVASLLVLFTHERRGRYYFRIFIDGTMMLQFILLLLFNSFQ